MRLSTLWNLHKYPGERLEGIPQKCIAKFQWAIDFIANGNHVRTKKTTFILWGIVITLFCVYVFKRLAIVAKAAAPNYFIRCCRWNVLRRTLIPLGPMSPRTTVPSKGK